MISWGRAFGAAIILALWLIFWYAIGWLVLFLFLGAGFATDDLESNIILGLIGLVLGVLIFVFAPLAAILRTFANLTAEAVEDRLLDRLRALQGGPGSS